MSTRVVTAVAAAHFLAYVMSLSISYGYGDPRAGTIIAVLGFPMSYLGDSIDPLLRASGHWWGDDLNLVLAYAVMNALIWGTAIAQVVRLVSRRKLA